MAAAPQINIHLTNINEETARPNPIEFQESDSEADMENEKVQAVKKKRSFSIATKLKVIDMNRILASQMLLERTALVNLL